MSRVVVIDAVHSSEGQGAGPPLRCVDVQALCVG